MRAVPPVFRALLVLITAALALPAGAAGDGSGDRPRVRGADGLVVQETSAVLPQPLVAAAASTAESATATLLADGFEGAFPGAIWTLARSSGAAAVDWGRSTYRRSSGSASIWCAGGGSAAPGAGGTVPVNTASWVIAGPFDLRNATSGTFAFDLWLTTESGWDYFKWLASTNGSNFSGYQTSTNTSGWQRVEQDLSDWGSAGNLLGQPQVWIAFLYTSDGSNRYEGAYVDQVSLTTDAGGGGSECGTYVLTNDNDNNASSGVPDNDWHDCLFRDDPLHPIEFHFDINETSVSAAQLLLLCNDVDRYNDTSFPEIDKVYVNGTYVGDLTGADDEDSTTVFTVPPSALLVGRNWVDIHVNQYPGSPADEWCVELKQAQLVINGGCSGQADCRSVRTNAASYGPGATVAVTYEIDTAASSQQVRVESNLVDPSGVIVAGTDQVYTTNGAANDPRTVNLVLPSNAAAGTYTAQVLVFDAASGALESSCQASFTVTGGGGGCNVSCSASVPATVQVGVPVQFSGSASVSGCTAAPEYFWFPDTTTTATVFQQSFTHTYSAPGTYGWQLVVIAGEGRCERNGTITVTSGGGGGTATTAWVPVGSRASGSNNSIWRTDLGILNGSGSTVSVQVTIFTAAGAGATRTVNIGPYGQQVITDVIGWLVPNSTMSGSIRVTANGQIFVTSRTYNAFPTGAPCFPRGTMGQALDGLLAAGTLGTGQSGWLPHLVENASFRSNLGYTNTGSTNATVSVTLFSGNGAQIGGYSVSLAPGEWKQTNQPFRTFAGQTNMAAGSARVTVTSGGGVVAYGSVIDNITNDPTTIALRR